MTPQMIPENAPTPPVLPAILSEPARLVGVFFSPSDTFPDIVRRPRWWIPIILLAIVSSVVATTYGRKIGWDKLVRTQILQSPQMEQATPEARENAVRVGTTVAGFIGYVTPVTVAFLILLVSAGLIFIFNTLMGAELQFPSMMGIVSYSYLPSVLSGLLTLLVMNLKDPEDFDLQRPLAFNVGAFLPDGLPRWAVQLGTSLDMFSFWTMALIAIGVSSSVRKIGFGKALMAVVVPWAVIILLRTFALIAFS